MAIILVLLGLFLRLFRLGMRPFDGDEGVILLQATPKGFHEMLTLVAKDAHPPLAIFFSWLLNKVVPQSEFYYRLVPVITGTLALVALYFLAKEIFGKKDKIKSYLVLVLGVISPYLIFYAQEIRMYNFLLLFSVLSSLYTIKLTKKIDLKSSIFYTLTVLLMIYTVHIGWIIIFCQILFMLISKVNYKRLVLMLVFIILGYLPIVKMAVNQTVNRLSEGSGVFGLDLMGNIKGISGAFFRFGSGRLMLDLNPATLKNMLFHELLMFLLFLVLLLVPVILFINGYRTMKDKKIRLLVSIFFITSIIIALVYSEMGGRAVRYFVYLFPFYLIVICSVKPTLFNKILIGMFIAINLVSLYNRYFVEFKAKSIKDIVPILNANYNTNYQKDDIVFFKGHMSSGETYVFNYYTRGKFAYYDYWGDYKIGNLKEVAARKESDIIGTLLQSHPRVWFYAVGYTLDKPLPFKNVEIYDIGKDGEGVEEMLYKVSN